MARQDCEVRCLPHEFLLMQPVVRATQLPRTRSLLHVAALQRAYFLSFTAPTNLHCPAPEVPDKPKKGTPNKPQRERVVAQPSTPTTPITVPEVPWEELLDSVKKVVKVSMGSLLQIFNTHQCLASNLQKKVQCLWPCSKVLYLLWVMQTQRYWKPCSLCCLVVFRCGHNAWT